jgi:hypothetical protein
MLVDKDEPLQERQSSFLEWEKQPCRKLPLSRGC